MLRSVTLASAFVLAATATAHAYLPGATPSGWAAISTKSDSWTKSSGYGDWGAGYSLYARSYYALNGAAADSITVEAKISAWGRMFGEKANVLDYRGEGTSTAGGSRRYEVRTFGREIFNPTWHELPSKSTTSTTISLSQTTLMLPIFQAEARFYGVLTARAAGRIEFGYSASGTWSGTNANIKFAPEANAIARLTLSVDVIVLEGGPYGELSLIKPKPTFRTTSSANPNCAGPRLTSDIDLVLREFDGEVGFFVRALAWTKEWELDSWNGLSQTIELDPMKVVEACF